MTGRLLAGLLIGAVSLSTASAGTPLDPTGGHTGFIPIGRNALRCERFINKRSAMVTFCTMLCHFHHVARAFRGLAFDENACEETLPNSCRVKFEKSLTLVQPGICPACMQPPQQEAVYGPFKAIAETVAGMTYCAPGTPFSSTNAGLVPSQIDTLKCEQGVAKNASKAVKCLALRCHRTLADTVFQGGEFDVANCEDTAQPGSCLARYREQNARLTACPPCLDEAQRDAIFYAIKNELDTKLGMAYCDSPSGAFVD